MNKQVVKPTRQCPTERPLGVPERRDGERHVTLYRVGAITVGERRELCLIKNISARGMMIQAYRDLVMGEAALIELKSGKPILGTVNWACGSNVGLTFDEPIDVIDILTASMVGPQPRMPRVEVCCHVTVRSGASLFRVRACDISQGGVKLATDVVPPEGTDVLVTFADLPPLRGVVRWIENGFCGVTLNGLLPLPILVNWLQNQRTNASTTI